MRIKDGRASGRPFVCAAFAQLLKYRHYTHHHHKKGEQTAQAGVIA